MEQPRPNVFKVSLNELRKFFPGIDFNTTDKYDVLNYELKSLLKHLRTNGSHLRRGDIVSLEGFESAGNKDIGKVIFNGVELENLGGDTILFPPGAFQVITSFDPYYWKGIINSNCVCYNFENNFPNPHPKEVKRIGNTYYFQVIHNGIIYKLIGDMNPSLNLSEEGYLRQLRETELFMLEPKNLIPNELKPDRLHLYFEIRATEINNEPWEEGDGYIEKHDKLC